jgi:hypothetical protein
VSEDWRQLARPGPIAMAGVTLSTFLAASWLDLDVLVAALRLLFLAVAIATFTGWARSKLPRGPLLGVLLGAVAAGAIHLALIGWWNHVQPREYDFFALYLDGRVAWLGLDFYEPRSYQETFAGLEVPFQISPGFQRNVLEVGTKYPPPTLLYLLPFGALDRASAHLAWVGISFGALAVIVLAGWRSLLPGSGLLGLLGLAALVVSQPAARLHAQLEQIHLPAAAFGFLAWAQRERAVSGAWIALATILKPPWAALALAQLLQRRIPALLGLTLATLGICALTVAIFGVDAFVRVAQDNPNLRVSPEMLYEDMNRSLLAHAMRTWPVQGDPMAHPAFLGGALSIATLTAVAVWRGRRNDELLTALLLSAALLVYPGTQRHYAILLLLPLLLTGQGLLRLGAPAAAVTIGMFTVAALGTAATYAVTLAVWLSCLAALLRAPGEEGGK